ncbi:sporulation protein YtxC [Thermoclostridium stercorarium subsp. stercorarium DSM 8532]|jgi:putative sporulation protein YtxC|uniref:Sporulation protein YtxC n=3 Tax=Thermoclostridium stercorarium TaxID=1510 RepID=L7VKV7_THES1|nr:putative sporulation protein YtxC [Thermoclostridium stercorarium]AGC67382.1 sporulation protein YtxC [Thermoclostridium stercorarium subsp. stercorarium DSM 8532]AGI38442.1 YtxC [Thermoclostridium stercorarium subsp. stercorarium DSM 8532]ANW97873.1 sporulation protein [Thermoclostridium stercorarium subsp. thermolacticum DSM 2910]ANX00425.1 sporulation protein [Thermoclostridium stercorarium subsp. leptospartum DSM 9219]UZQ85970.1 putative sporulation protein YtxC [Thermoclostridium sterc
MQPVRITAGDGAGELLNFLQKELVETSNDGELFKVNHEEENGLIAVECTCKGKFSGDKTFVEHLSQVLAEYLITAYDDMLLKRIAKKNYGYLKPDERREIINIAQKKIRDGSQNLFDTILKIRRKNLVTRKLADFLNQNDHIILEGFVTFRMQEYVKELEEVMDWAVRQYLIEKEYQEFIKLLTCFVQMQKPKFRCVHIIAEKDSGFSLYDENMERISDQYLLELAGEQADGIIKEEDLLISFLISAAPRQIIMHNISEIRNKELIDTIMQVFSGRVTAFND